MKSLVYDFGQLESATEQQYTIKIVEKHVSRSFHNHQKCLKLCTLQLLDTIKFENPYVANGLLGRAIANILNVSQDFMRRTKVVYIAALHN